MREQGGPSVQAEAVFGFPSQSEIEGFEFESQGESFEPSSQRRGEATDHRLE